ncbi:MAG: ABC transporter permease [Planktomarina sp.]
MAEFLGGNAGFWRRLSPWATLGAVIAGLVIFPLLAILWLALTPTDNIWPHLLDTVLPRYAVNTGILMISVGAGAAVLGTALAYVVTHFTFPGRGWLQYALLAPLAIPGYVGAYALVDFLEYAGPVQTGLRNLFGWQSARDYWFFDVRSMGSAIFVLTLTLYPYVYLLARASFRALPASGADVARSLGLTPWQSFWRMALPLARPGIVAGMAVVMMETVNDFGTVEFFAVQTLTTGIFSVWLESYNPGGAAQLALCALTVIAVLAAIEKISRRNARFAKSARQMACITPAPLRNGLWATAVCVLPILVGFVLPVSILSATADWETGLRAGLLGAVTNSAVLGFITSFICVLLAVMVVFGLRDQISKSRLWATIVRTTGLGYAIPGAVLGLGVLMPLAAVDRTLAEVWMSWTDERLGLLLTGTGAALLFAYVVRFFAIALGAAEAGFAAIPPNLPLAGRTLGLTPRHTLIRIFAPLLKGSVLSAMLLVFVDTVKELPATLLLRPFNFDTLATYTYDQASLEKLEAAAPGALIIVFMSLLAVLLLARLNR